VRARRYVVLGLQVAGWIAFASYRIREAAAYAPAVWQDSKSYLDSSHQGWLSAGLWTGSRAPGTPVLLKLTAGNFGHYATTEAVLGALAWGFLAWTVGRLVAPGWRGVMATWAVLAFATAPLVVQWDWSALSESPSLSALAVLCAAGLWTVRRFTWIRLAAIGAAALAYVALRDAEIWGVGVVGVALLLVATGRVIEGAAVRDQPVTVTVRQNYAAARAPLLTGAVLAAVSLVAAVAADASHRNVSNMEDVFYVRIFPFPERVAWFAAHGMPEGAAVDQLAAQTPAPAAGMAKLVVPPLSSPSWRPLDAWIQDRAQSTYVFYLATNPAYVIAAPFATPPLTYDNALGELDFYQPPDRALPFFETAFAPGRVVVLLEAVLAAGVAIARRLWKDRTWRFLVAFTVVGLLTMLIAWHGDGQEVTRHMVEGDVEARLGVLVCLLYAALVPARPATAGNDTGGAARLWLPGPTGAEPSSAGTPPPAPSPPVPGHEAPDHEAPVSGGRPPG